VLPTADEAAAAVRDAETLGVADVDRWWDG
jgi:hypothetical protein